MNWEEKTEEYVQANFQTPPAGVTGPQIEAFSRLVMEGARWQREALLTDEVVESAAKAFYENAYTAMHESIRPSWSRLVEVEPDTADSYRYHMRAALTAAIDGGKTDD